jgi:hypothetical protein
MTQIEVFKKEFFGLEKLEKEGFIKKLENIIDD